MKKELILFSAFFLLIHFTIQAQSSDKKGASSLASLDLQAPVGVFARTHFAGAGLNYSWSHHRFGWYEYPKKWIGLTLNAGADYYFGKRIKPAGHSFRFDNYLYAYALAGMMVNAGPVTNISLTAGPAIGIYKGNSVTGMAANLFGWYYIEKNIAIGPGVSYKKDKSADALWSGAIRIAYTF